MTPPNDNPSYRRRRPDREEQRRRAGAADRERRDREAFDPAPPTDDDVTIGDRSGLRRLTGPKPVGDALDEFLKGTGWADRVKATRLLDAWPDLVGDSVAAHCRPVRIDRGELLVEAESPAWATQLTWLEQSIRQRVNEQAGEVLVRRVRIVVAGQGGEDGRGRSGDGRPGGGRSGGPADRFGHR